MGFRAQLNRRTFVAGVSASAFAALHGFGKAAGSTFNPRQVATPDVTPPTVGTVLYEADWSEDANGWSGAGWKTLNGMLLNDGSNREPSQWIAAPVKLEVADYAVEAEIQILSLSEYPSGSGIVSRSSDQGAYWSGVYHGNYLRIFQIAIPGNDSGVDAGDYTDDSYGLGHKDYAPGVDWHTYRVELSGNSITLLIDGSVALQSLDNRYLEGGAVGLWSCAAQVSVRRFTVTAL